MHSSPDGEKTRNNDVFDSGEVKVGLDEDKQCREREGLGGNTEFGKQETTIHNTDQ